MNWEVAPGRFRNFRPTSFGAERAQVARGMLHKK